MKQNKSEREMVMHVIHVMANNSTVPYFNWFADEVSKHPSLKFTFVAMCAEKPQMLDDMKKRGCECIWVKYNFANRKIDMLKAALALTKIFRKIKPDAVHTHLFDDSLPALLAAKVAGIKKRVITKADTTFHWFYARKWVRADQFNNQNATHIVAISEENKEFILDCEKADENKIHLIHHGVPLGLATRQIDKVKKDLIGKYNLQNKIVIGTIARLIEWKGYKDIINAAEKLTGKYPQIHFLFVGQGAQKEELQKIIAEKNLQDFITFTDWIAPEHIPSVYGIFDIYLHAAKFEPFGLVIAEAMLNGLPVVSTATGAAKDAIVHKENGYLVSYENMDDLANGIGFMIENDRRKIGSRAKETALKMYQFKIMFDNHKKLYFDEKVS